MSFRLVAAERRAIPTSHAEQTKTVLKAGGAIPKSGTANARRIAPESNAVTTDAVIVAVNVRHHASSAYQESVRVYCARWMNNVVTEIAAVLKVVVSQWSAPASNAAPILYADLSADPALLALDAMMVSV